MSVMMYVSITPTNHEQPSPGQKGILYNRSSQQSTVVFGFTTACSKKRKRDIPLAATKCTRYYFGPSQAIHSFDLRGVREDWFSVFFFLF